MTQLATFAAGCFWGIEAQFSKVFGVVTTVVGYAGGTTNSPTYEAVCTDTTGHAESVQIEFDPEKVSYEALLELFWKMHNPYQHHTKNQYRSVIFYHNEDQRRLAENSKPSKEVLTEIIPYTTFWRAEEYHQKYFEKT